MDSFVLLLITECTIDPVNLFRPGHTGLPPSLALIKPSPFSQPPRQTRPRSKLIPPVITASGADATKLTIICHLSVLLALCQSQILMPIALWRFQSYAASVSGQAAPTWHTHS